jgi:phasin family protein
MTRFSDQLTAVRQAQLQAQLDMFRTLSTRALDSAGQIAALNVRASRASMEQAAGTVKQLLEAREPRDLFALGSAAQQQWHSLFSYGRELFGLAVGTRMPPTANVPTSFAQIMEQASIATADATTITSEIAAAAVDTGTAHAEAALDVAIDAGNIARAKAAPAAPQPAAEPAKAPAAAPVAAPVVQAEAAIESAIADELPPAEPKPLAKALNEVAPKPAGAEHPLASTVPLQADSQVELPAVAPTERVAPPPKPTRGPRRK